MSIALGGDSKIEFSEAEEITVGPERSVPLCRASEETGFSAGDVIDRLMKSSANENNMTGSLINDGWNDPSGDIGDLLGNVKPLPFMAEDLYRAGPEKWLTKEFSYTPTDAFNTMGYQMLEIRRYLKLLPM